MKNIIAHLISWHQKMEKMVSAIINFIALTSVYFIGIGLTSVVAKIVGQKFLKTNQTKSTWKKIERGKIQMEKMY